MLREIDNNDSNTIVYRQAITDRFMIPLLTLSTQAVYSKYLPYRVLMQNTAEASFIMFSI